MCKKLIFIKVRRTHSTIQATDAISSCVAGGLLQTSKMWCSVTLLAATKDYRFGAICIFFYLCTLPSLIHRLRE
jgi:hypothetical protein